MTDYAYEMYRSLLTSALTHVDFTADMSYRLKQIVEKHHCGNGYFSMDGILDDLSELIDNEDIASKILENA